jgi:hypothetical protein
VGTPERPSRREHLTARVSTIVEAIKDEQAPSEAVLRLSRSRRWLAPLALAVGAFEMLFEGLKLLVLNWRLLLIQVLPALWVWAAMLDLKLHVLHGKSVHSLKGPVLIPIALAIVAVTIAGFFLNTVFAFSIAGPRPPHIGTAYALARSRLRAVSVYGGVVGAALAVATLIAPRWGHPWFALTLGVVVGVMMLSYVAVPSRLIGVKPTASRRDKLTASVLSGALSATVCTPPYLLGRIGILMLGSRALLIPGILVLATGATLQAGATGAVRAIKLGAALATGHAAVESPRASGAAGAGP